MRNTIIALIVGIALGIGGSVVATKTGLIGGHHEEEVGEHGHGKSSGGHGHGEGEEGGDPLKLTAEQMDTKADVTLEKEGEGFAITSVHLTLQAKIPGADKAKFEELAGKAKAGCPVLKLLNTKITLDATLV